MGRGIAYTREQRNKHIKRKKRICNNFYGFDWYKHDGMYNKGKIHCSCKMCTYGKTYDLPTIKDELMDEIFKFELKDFDES